ncbi:MAG: hypothetical protein ACK5LX_05095 [Oscillospiraceae bacterium]
MKKVMSVLISIIMIIGLCPVAMASPVATLGYSVQNTIPGAGAASSDIAGTLKVNQSFTVTFSGTSFKWSDTGNNTYELGKLTAAWVNMTGATLNQDFSVTGVQVNSATGAATVTIKALRPYSGNIQVSLNGGAGAAKAFQADVSVVAAESRVTGTKAGGTAPTKTAPNGSSLSILAGETLTYRVPANNFAWDPADGTKNPASITDTSWIKLKNADIAGNFSVAYTPTTDGTGDVMVVLTALRGGSYSGLSLYLQSSGGAATTASDSISLTVTEQGGGKITGIASGAKLGGTGSGALLNGTAISYDRLGSLDANPGDELLIPLYAGFFTWEGTAPYAGTPVTNNQLRSGKITVGMGSRKGKQVFDANTPEIVQVSGRAYIKVKFADLPRTKGDDTDFAMQIYLSVDKRRHTDSQLDLEGTMIQEVYTLYDENYVDLSDGTVIEPDKYLRNVELYLGANVTMFANLYQGKRYYGTAEMTMSGADQEILDKFPSIEMVIALNTFNLNKSSNKVTFDFPEKFYVYNADGKYLGRSNEKLPYSSKYYLSSKDIDMGGGDVSEPDDPNTVLPPAEGNISEPGAVPPQNINENPSTGR